MKPDEPALKNGVSILSKKYQFFLLLLSIMSTANNECPITKLISGCNTGLVETILQDFICFKHLEQHTLAVCILFGLCAMLFLCTFLRIALWQMKTSENVFACESHSRGPIEADSACEKEVVTKDHPWALYALWALILLEAISFIKMDFQRDVILPVENYEALENAHASIVEKCFLFCNTLIVLPDEYDIVEHSKYHFFNTHSGTLKFPLAHTRLFIYSFALQIITPFVISFALTNLNSRKSEKYKLKKFLHRFFLVRIVIHLFRGLFVTNFGKHFGPANSYWEPQYFLSDKKSLLMLIVDPQFYTRYFVTLAALIAISCYFYLFASTYASDALSDPSLRKGNVQDMLQDPHAHCEKTYINRIHGSYVVLVRSFCIIVLPYLLSLTAISTAYSLQILLPKIIGILVFYLIFVSISSALFVANYDCLGMTVTFITLIDYFMRSQSILNSSIKYLTVSFMLTWTVHGFAIFQKMNTLSLYLFSAVHIIFLSTLNVPISTSEALNNIRSVLPSYLRGIFLCIREPKKKCMSYFFSMFRSNIQNVFSTTVFGEVEVQFMTEKWTNSLYNELFHGLTLVKFCFWIAASIMLTFTFKSLWKISCVSSFMNSYRQVIFYSMKYFIMFFSIKWANTALYLLPFVSSIPVHFVHIVLAIALLALLGIQQEIEDRMVAIAQKLSG